ncbi:MAG: hypothetical protein HY400_02210 [Elusimicrobia bacterium]|nr:hypothetical protein [Elusimicrobiota bacterium]
MSEILGKPWKIIWLNFLAGISRGLGFTLGITLLAGVALAIIYKLLSHAIDVPLVGKYLAEFISEVQKHISQLGKVRP